MIRVMDMSTGEQCHDEFGEFSDEVLGAQWLVPQPALRLQARETERPQKSLSARDADRFMASVYLNQR